MNLPTILTVIQAELKAPKDQRNNFGKYNYRSAEGILEALKPHLAKHKCCLTLSDAMTEVGGRVYVQATVTLRSGDESLSVSACAREAATRKGMDDSQITGATSSYARKYALNGMFAIDDTKDADATNDHGQAEESAPAKKNETKKPPTIEAILKSISQITDKAGLDNLVSRIMKTPHAANLEIKEAVAAKKTSLK